MLHDLLAMDLDRVASARQYTQDRGEGEISKG